MLVIILLQPTLVNRFCEVGRSRQRIMIPQKAMLENWFAKATKFLSQAEAMFSRTEPSQTNVDSTNPIIQQTQQRVVCHETGVSLR